MTRQPSSPPDSVLDLTAPVDAPAGRRWRWLGLTLALLAVLAGAAWLLLGERAAEPIRFETAEVRRGDLTVTVTATGTLQPVNQVDVGTEVSGTIIRVAVDFNDRVGTGQILAELDPEQALARTRQAGAALALAQARVQEAEATVTETTNKLRRTRDLLEKRLASPEELDTATAAAERAAAALAVAQAQVAQAQAEVDANRRTLEKTVIRSPIDGIVLKRVVEPGQTVAASLQTPVLFTLAETLTQMELNAAVDEADVGQVSAGQTATFSVDAYPNRRFPARLTQVRYAPETINGVVTYAALLSVANDDLALRPGMTATAEILVTELEDVVLIPNTALRFRPPRPEVKSKPARRSLLGMLIPRRSRSAQRPGEIEEDPRGPAHAWVLASGEPQRVPVATGPSDGTLTQVLDDSLPPGTEVLVDVARSRNGT